MTPVRTRAYAALLGLALVTTACGSSNPDPIANGGEAVGAQAGVPSAVPSPSVTIPAASDAAQLRARLVQLLGERASALGLLAQAGTAAGGPDGATGSARDVLARTTDELTTVFTTAYGAQTAARFRALWANETEALLSYAGAAGTGPAAPAQDQQLASFATQFGQLMAQVTNGLASAAAISASLTSFTTSLTAAMAALATRSPQGPALLYHVVTTAADAPATAIAAATSARYPNAVTGDARSAAAQLRARLTELLSAHALAAGLFAQAARLAGVDSATAAAAHKALSSATDDLTAVFTKAYDEATGTRFDEIWAAHNDVLTDYVKGYVTGDEELQALTGKGLDTFPEDFGDFVENVTEGRLRHDDVQARFIEAQQRITAAIQDFATAAPDAIGTLGDAQSYLYGPADELATTITLQFPTKFAPSPVGAGAGVTSPSPTASATSTPAASPTPPPTATSTSAASPSSTG